MVTWNEYKTDSKAYKWMIVSIVLLWIVIWGNIAIYFYNSHLERQILSQEQELQNLEKNVSELKNNDKVKLYTLLQANNSFIEVYNKTSQIPEYINNLNVLSRIYRVTFENFQYSNSIISTNVKAKDDAKSLSYQKAKNFIASFRDQTTPQAEKKPHIFSLNFIHQFEWQDEIKFNIWLKLK